jgi:predicted dinucleotide-binding enzyme
MRAAFIGIGNVGFAIASHLQKTGHAIIIGSNNDHSESVKKALERNSSFIRKSVQEAIDASDIVFLATPYLANEEALKGLHFNGKTLVDCTNPVGPGITHGLQSQRSGSEVVQELAPDAKVVKAFTIYGFENFSDCSFPEYNVKPVMLIAGDDKSAKQQVRSVTEDLGFAVKDTGPLTQALHLEHMTLLWVKMVRMGGNPNFVWAYLEN